MLSAYLSPSERCARAGNSRTITGMAVQDALAAELVLYPDGGHGVTNLAYESRSRMGDWLASHLERR